MQRIIYILTLFLSSSLIAQNSLNEPLSLDNAISYAMEHSPTLNIEKMKLEEAAIQLNEIRLQRVPDIYLSGDLRRNLIIPATPVPANAFDPSAPEGEMMYMRFNTNWNSSAGVNINYDLFNPDKTNRAAEQKHQLKIQEYDAQISENDLKNSVAIAYAETIIAGEQLQLLKEDTTYFSELFRNANELYKRERVSLSEKNDAHKAFNESLAAHLDAERIFSERKAELLFLIGMDITEENIQTLTLSEDIPLLLEKMERKALPVQSASFLEELRQQEVVDLASLRVKSASLKYAPTLSLNGYYGTNFYNNEFSLFNNSYWRGNSYIGLSLKMPITQSLTTTKEVSRMRLQQQMESENLRNIRNDKEKERLNNLSLLKARKENYLLSRENWELSQQNSVAVRMQFEKGYIQQSDLLNERLKTEQSRQAFLQSAYDLFNTLTSFN